MVGPRLIDSRREESSGYAWRDSEMLVVTKGSCAVCVDLQAVGVLEFFGL